MNRVIFGDCRDTMRDLKAQGVRVQCCVTSPPYFGLRDYGADGQIGLESTPNQYIAKLVEVFSALREILADDGTLWLNLGDSYAGSGKGAWSAPDERKVNVKEVYRPTGNTAREAEVTKLAGEDRKFGFKNKDLMMIPARVAMALQADGWYLRSACPWLKRNAMPDSTRDRPTTSIETIFLLSKSPKYYYDNEAVKVLARTGANGSRFDIGKTAEHQLNRASTEPRKEDGKRARRASDWFFESWQGMLQDDEGDPLAFVVNTKPYREAHFATFPPKLIAPCIVAGCLTGGVVIDPFGGSGTTGEVATSLGRSAILCELNPDYVNLASARNRMPQTIPSLSLD